MIKKLINQKTSQALEILDSLGYEHDFGNSPINRLNHKNKSTNQDIHLKSTQLENLKKELDSINNCKLKENSKQLVFGDGNINSPIMIIGGAPAEQENLSGKTYMGEDGQLLKKMLNAINIKKNDIYSTYAIKFLPPIDRKPTTEEMKRYAPHLQKHISIIKPKLIILMGSIAMETLSGINKKISLERGKWKEIIIENSTYDYIITFDPSYLLRVPENKKYSWEDLKTIKNRIEELNLNI